MIRRLRRNHRAEAGAETQRVLDEALKVRGDFAAITARLGIHVERLQSAVERLEKLDPSRSAEEPRDGDAEV